MSYRDDLVAENNALRNELAAAREDNLVYREKLGHWRRRTGSLALLAVSAALFFCGIIALMTLRAPLASGTRGAADEFCKALDEQAREEEKERHRDGG